MIIERKKLIYEHGLIDACESLSTKNIDKKIIEKFVNLMAIDLIDFWRCPSLVKEWLLTKNEVIENEARHLINLSMQCSQNMLGYSAAKTALCQKDCVSIAAYAFEFLASQNTASYITLKNDAGKIEVRRLTKIEMAKEKLKYDLYKKQADRFIEFFCN
jgi:hypothetical protein